MIHEYDLDYNYRRGLENYAKMAKIKIHSLFSRRKN
jgi:hypothetical protein